MQEDDCSRQWDHIRHCINRVALERGEYGGYPLPDDEIPITLEPRFPLTSLNGAVLTDHEPTKEAMNRAAQLFGFTSEDQRIIVVNYWHSERAGGDVYLYYFEGEPNKVKATVIPKDEWTREVEQLIRTLGCSRNWSVSAEETALGKLRSLITPAAYRYYVLTGMFMETSKRSGVTYLFHRLRPTIAFKHQPDGSLKVLASLCGHPIGYYDGSFAGAMVATDDVIAHVVLMRGDEHLFWRKCNQHAPGSVAI